MLWFLCKEFGLVSIGFIVVFGIEFIVCFNGKLIEDEWVKINLVLLFGVLYLFVW